jgi:hypothetical protein
VCGRQAPAGGSRTRGCKPSSRAFRRIRGVSACTLWGVRPHPKRKELHHQHNSWRWWAWRYRRLRKFCPHRKNWIGSHLITEPLGRSGTRERAAGAAGEQSLQDGPSRKDVTIRYLGTEGTAIHLGCSGRAALRREQRVVFR